jgi:hypothetical protein
MGKLTALQQGVLVKASAREDGVASFPRSLSKAAMAKVGASLIARKLMREVRSKPSMSVWREDKAGKSFSLVITQAGRDALADRGAEKGGLSASKAKGSAKRGRVGSSTRRSLRLGTKRALIVEMLSTGQGASIDALIKATGWLPHTMRAALTGLRKKGFAVTRSQDVESGRSAYRILRGANPAA